MEKTPRGDVAVVLSVSDQKAFGIRYATMSFSDPRTRRFCEQMAVLVCLREGMDNSGNVTVRAVENPSGDLILYFSLPKEDGSRRLFSRVLEFADVDRLLDCRRVFPKDPRICAEIYRYAGKYYLWFEFYADSHLFGRLTGTLLEYGVSSPLDRSFLAEHATLLPGAVSLYLA